LKHSTCAPGFYNKIGCDDLVHFRLTIRGSGLHNLKNVLQSIPQKQIVVLTGLSASGKPVPGFDVLHQAGRRQ
jgi:excinuclease UvrABC ATPase subunit